MLVHADKNYMKHCCTTGFFGVFSLKKLFFVFLLVFLVFPSIFGEEEPWEDFDETITEETYYLPEAAPTEPAPAFEAEPALIDAPVPDTEAAPIEPEPAPDEGPAPDTEAVPAEPEPAPDDVPVPDTETAPDAPEPIEPEPEIIPIPPIPEYILGQGLIPENLLSDFVLYYNPWAQVSTDELANLYVEEADMEGVNHDAAFAQMCLETGFLGFGGLVVPEMNNFCGLGAIGPGQNGEWFPDPRTGVRAHIQHLKAYATEEPLNQDLVDPRRIWVRNGSSPKISGLSGTWAEDLLYGEKINSILERLYEFAFIKKYDMTEVEIIMMDETIIIDEIIEEEETE